MMTVTEELERILKGINGGAEASAVASRDGLLVCSTMQKRQDADTFAAISAAMIGAAETAAIVLGKGVPERVIVETKLGRIIATGAGPKAVLLVMTKQDAGLGLILIEMTKAAEKIKLVLE